MSGRAGAGNGIVDHLAREDERGHDGHRRQLFLCKLRRGGLFLVELDQRNARRGRGSRVHRDGHCRGYQRVSHVHRDFLLKVFLLLLYRTHRPGARSPGDTGRKKFSAVVRQTIQIAGSKFVEDYRKNRNRKIVR